MAAIAPRAGAWIETGRPAAAAFPRSIAPRAGAWIETSRLLASYLSLLIAPRAGAWIETVPERLRNMLAASPLARGRGLKRGVHQEPDSVKVSPLARGRGLKLVISDASGAARPIAPR